MKCPHCGSENVNFISNTTTKGFRGGKACCGFLIWGWIGILCGLCGSGKQNTKEYWICNNCGNKFQNSDIKKMEQKPDSENIITKVKTLIHDNKTMPNTQTEQPKITVENNIVQSSNVPEIKENIIKHVINDPQKSSFEPKTKIERASRYEGTLSTEELLKRAEIFIEDKDWEKACEYCQNALDVDAGCAEAYLVKFLAEYNISSVDRISLDCAEMAAQLGSLFVVEDYKKASRFGDNILKEKLNSYNQQAIYNYAIEFSDKCRTFEDIEKAKIFFRRIPDYTTFKDVNERLAKCDKKGNLLVYNKASELLDRAKSSQDCDEASKLFESISDYNDSKQKAKECRDFKNKIIYDTAKKLLYNANQLSDFEEAQRNFLLIKNYKDSERMAEECIKSKNQFIYNGAYELINAVDTDVNFDMNIMKECLKNSFDGKSDFKKAIRDNLAYTKISMLEIAQKEFESIAEYNDSNNKATECREKIETLKENYKKCIAKIRKIIIIAAVVIVSIIIFCILIPVIFSSLNNDENEEITAQETIISEYEDSATVISESNAETTTEKSIVNAEPNVSIEPDNLYDNFILYESTYNSNTVDYIGTYNGWTYFSDVIDVISENQLYLYGTVYFCNVAIKRINIETGECENLIETYCLSSVYDGLTQYYNYDFTIGDDGKLVFSYDDPNTLTIVSSDEYGGKESYYCDSYVLSYDVNTNEISQLCYDISQSQYFYYNGWLLRHFTNEGGKHLLIDTIHNETYEDSSNCWVKGYDGKYLLLTYGDSFYVINTISSEISEYHNMDLDFIYIHDRGDYLYLSDENGIVKYILDIKKQSCSDSIPIDAVEAFLPTGSRVIGENNTGLIYQKGNYVCMTDDYHDADFSNDRIFNLKNIIDHEKEIYIKYGIEYEFENIFYYDFSVCGKWIVINTSVHTIDVSYENYYYLNSETGVCSNLPMNNGTGQYKDASSYISNNSNTYDFEFSIGYVSIDSGVLNVRSEPSFDSDIIGTLENNSKIEIYDYQNGWYLIYYYDYDTNLYGYVKSDFVITF